MPPSLLPWGPPGVPLTPTPGQGRFQLRLYSFTPGRPPVGCLGMSARATGCFAGPAILLWVWQSCMRTTSLCFPRSTQQVFFGGLLCAHMCVCTQACVFVSHSPRSDKCCNKGNKHGAQGTWKEKLSLSEQSRKASWRRGHLLSCRMSRTWIVMEEKDSVCSGAVSGGG